jgi:[phosphatase 2A protein]-leucine-carboxy methyltransferase
MMVSNLEERGLYLPGLEAYPSLMTQKERYVRAGFGHVAVMTLNDYWDSLISGEEKERIQRRTEFLDELEEWRLFGSHYCLVYAETKMG